MFTAPEERFDRICRVASKLLQTPIAYVSLLDEETQFFKAAVGLGGVTETGRADSFCTHTIEQADPLYVPDATDDHRFRDNPYVKGPPGVRCYLGEPLFSTDGHAVGTFCILDTQPRELDPEMRRTFRDLASLAERELNLLAQLHQQRKLTELTSHLVSSLDQNQIADTLLGVLADSIYVERAAVAIKEGDRLRIASSFGGQTSSGIFDLRCPPQSCFSGGAVQCVRLPIVHQGMSLGVLWVERRRDVPFTTLENELISSFVVQAGLILENRAILANLFEQSRLVSLGSLAAGVAHEINSPLGAARLGVESALRTAGEETRLAKNLTRVNKALGKAAKIIQGVLQYAGEGPDLSSSSNVDEVLEQTLVLVNHDMTVDDIVLMPSLSAPVEVALSQNELQTVLHHLIQNAAWAVMLPGAYQRRIRVESSADDDTATITVTDLGPGVGEEISNRIFDPFFTSKDPGEGVGLGLSVSRKLAEKAGGRLQLMPSEKGARFQVSFPRKPEKAAGVKPGMRSNGSNTDN